MPDDKTPDGAPPPPADPPPPPAAPAAKAAPADDTTMVRLAFPHDEFHSGVDGVPVITRQPTEILTASLEDVQKAARKSRVTVTTIEEK